MATSAGKGTDGSCVAEGSHMVGTLTGILRAEEEVVKETKDWLIKGNHSGFGFCSLLLCHSFSKSIFNLGGAVGWVHILGGALSLC